MSSSNQQNSTHKVNNGGDAISDKQPKPIRPDDGGQRTKKPRGFAAMDPALVSEIARKGGKAAHKAGAAHEFTREEARAAGSKGGAATRARKAEKTKIDGKI